ncbi:MAG: flavin-containing monooxygenase [Acidimicrobiales bacterium]
MSTQHSSYQGSARRIAIIGAGPGGLCMGIKLKEAGFENFVILEKGSGVGGTWYHNSYPGAACDIQSALYSYSFEMKVDWSRPYGTQPEIRAYLEQCAAKYGMLPYIRFDTAVRKAYWDEECLVWRLVTEHGDEVVADVVVSAIGMFNELNYPDIEGLGSFKGTLFHSARWNHEHDLTGERVGVIGSAASAVQFVPEIAKVVGQLDLYQRTANWVVPRDDDPYDEETLERFRRDPSLVRQFRLKVWREVEKFVTFPANLISRAERAGLRNLEVVKDPEVRRKLTPTHSYGCKRPLISNDYYPTFNRPNVLLITDRIERVTPTGIRTVEGVEREVDTIVLATGFHVDRYLSAIDVSGRDGASITDAWADGAQAYLGMSTAGFPNLFMLYGPNTNGGSSMIHMLELEVGYIMRQLRRMDEEGLASLEVKRDVMERYNDALQAEIEKIDVWHGDCSNYYRSESGRMVTQYPHPSAVFRAMTAAPDPDAFLAQPGVPIGVR